jgi:ABC-type multidrug transport system permease subunit
MNNKTFWIGFVVVYVAWQALGFVIHETMMAETYQGLVSTFRPEAEMNDMMWMMMVSSAVMMYMFCFIFTRGYEGKGIMEGMRYGVLIAFMMASPMVIEQHVIYSIPENVATTWLVATFVSFIIVGAIFAAIYKPETAAQG